jgi:putative ABC transport system ATP-binding protein
VAPERAPIVECTNLLRVFESATGRVQAVRGVDLSIDAGRTVAVVGPSGSGKSSLLRMIAGLDEPSAGDVYVDGVNLARLSNGARSRIRARLLAHVHQRPTDNLLGHLTALDQVERVARRRGASRGDAIGMLDRLGLADRAAHFPHELSGGEQQRLAFARGAVGDPVLIIADEPTAELDTSSTHLVLDAVERLAADGITVLLATHDPQVLERVDEVVTLRDGSVASVTSGGAELAVIDQAGRIQLPPEVRKQFPHHRARLTWDPDGRRLTVEEP